MCGTVCLFTICSCGLIYSSLHPSPNIDLKTFYGFIFTVRETLRDLQALKLFFIIITTIIILEAYEDVCVC